MTRNCASGLSTAKFIKFLTSLVAAAACLLGQTMLHAAAVEVADGVFVARGVSNSYLVVTPEGNVVIDTGPANMARRQYDQLREADDGPVRYLVMTHAHIDHAGGIGFWRGGETTLVAQRRYPAELAYQQRLDGFFARRNAAQFGMPAASINMPDDEPAAERAADIVFDESHEFALGGLTFHLQHTPGETPDHLSVWIPKLEIAFVGDNYYDSFPNLYALRGTKPRWALDYVESLDTVIAWAPELLLSGHVAPIEGRALIRETLGRYRDAIRYVHDQTVAGMNAGKGVYELMQEVTLPESLDVGQKYGAVTWSVRGIYEGYVGWFDEKPENLYRVPSAAVYPDLVDLAGGADAMVALAEDKLDAGLFVEGLHLTSVVLEADPVNQSALRVRIEILKALESKATNFNERSWLRYARRKAAESYTGE